ncbi:MAG TPA: SDR family oxidoreductase, partial [Gemmatimonadales bacterium]|nr:SDR family oxidoreductase [Gemmatimonadales bacterium]
MKIAIVTGGSSGIGRAAALELGKRGVGVILTYLTNQDRADAVVREIEKDSGIRAAALRLDLARQSTFDAFVRDVEEVLPELWSRTTFDYLVNNGGNGSPMAFQEMSEEYFDRILDTNFKGPVFLTQRLVGLMENGGAIVNTSSTARGRVFPGFSAYGS